MVLTTIPPIFAEIYHENAGIIGLQYVSLGIGERRRCPVLYPALISWSYWPGLSVASQINARLLDIVYRRLKAKNGGVGEPEFRLRQ